MEKLIIIKDEHPIEDTVEEVLRLLKQGYTSGYDPTWYFEKTEKKERRDLSHKQF